MLATKMGRNGLEGNNLLRPFIQYVTYFYLFIYNDIKCRHVIISLELKSFTTKLIKFILQMKLTAILIGLITIVKTSTSQTYSVLHTDSVEILQGGWRDLCMPPVNSTLKGVLSCSAVPDPLMTVSQPHHIYTAGTTTLKLKVLLAILKPSLHSLCPCVFLALKAWSWTCSRKVQNEVQQFCWKPTSVLHLPVLFLCTRFLQWELKYSLYISHWNVR